MLSDDDMADSDSTWRVPAAFYSDDPPPLPPRDDPHRVEFYAEREPDTLPNWMLLGMPVVLILVALLHGVVAVVLLLLLHH